VKILNRFTSNDSLETSFIFFFDEGAFGTDFYDRSTRTIVGTMPWPEYRPVIKIGPKGALGSHEIRPIHSAPSLGQSILAPGWIDGI